MRILLFLFVLLNMSTAMAAVTPECNVALETCKADCAQRPINDRDRGGRVTRTDFVPQCQNACLDAANWCVKQDSTASCTTFAYHCQSQCPWSVVDYDHQRLNHTDSFRQCEESCNAGAFACEPFRKGMPPRKRSGEFDQCPEAQTACYADCIFEVKDKRQDISIIDTDYPDKCAAACAQGVQDCQVLDDAESCDTYEVSCWAGCPSSVTAFGQEKSDPMVQQWCRNSCSAGRAYCRALLNLPFDRKTAPPLPAAAVKQAEPVKPPAPQTPAVKPAAQASTKQPAGNALNNANCDKAEMYCKDDCRKNKIILVMNGIWPQRYSNEAETDFWGQCESACGRAQEGCRAGLAFKGPCQDGCPKVYHDKTGNTFRDTDGLGRCQWSCQIGEDAYEGTQDLDICQRASATCREDCEYAADSDNAAEACDAACKAGEAQCPKAWFYEYCKTFYDTCNDACPQSGYEHDECEHSCDHGASICDDRANLRYE